MKLLILFVFAIIGLAAAKPVNDGECIWVNGSCTEQCPAGTHSYTTGCDYVLPEATCENPKPVLDTRSGQICDFTACYCNTGTVRDTRADKCVPLNECPKTKKE